MHGLRKRYIFRHVAKNKKLFFSKYISISVGIPSSFDNCIVGGFNVSNLMGITWRMIDIGKKITFYFLQNV
jgi:hypothetical protein